MRFPARDFRGALTVGDCGELAAYIAANSERIAEALCASRAWAMGGKYDTLNPSTFRPDLTYEDGVLDMMSVISGELPLVGMEANGIA